MGDHDASIYIGELHLRMAGNGADAAHRVANGVVHRLKETVRPGVDQHFGALSVRVRVPAGATESEASDAVAAAIAKVLGRGEQERR